jgi:D-alanyl-D-alanine dipeptidase
LERARKYGVFTLIVVALLISGLIIPRLLLNPPVNDAQMVLSDEPDLLPQQKKEMVILDIYVPEVRVDLMYAGNNNIYGERLYDSKLAFLRRGTAEKLRKAQEEFALQGYTLKIWDAYRPPEVQFKLWQAMPDARFVINPHQGYSLHSRGVALDVTLVDKNGNELLMPTGFDNFTTLADRDYKDIEETEAANARLLEEIMAKHGFRSIFYEWWHFIDQEGQQYPVVTRSQLPLLLRKY